MAHPTICNSEITMAAKEILFDVDARNKILAGVDTLAAWIAPFAEAASYGPPAALLVDDTIELPVQVNGKVRGKVVIAADADEETAGAAAGAPDAADVPMRSEGASGPSWRSACPRSGRCGRVR